jgi:hypothetical protein
MVYVREREGEARLFGRVFAAVATPWLIIEWEELLFFLFFFNFKKWDLK